MEENNNKKNSNKALIIILVLVIGLPLFIILFAGGNILATKGIASSIREKAREQAQKNSEEIVTKKIDESTTKKMSNEEAKNIVKEIMDKYYNEVFHLRKSMTYCGDIDRDDILEGEAPVGEYYASITYNNLNDVKKYLNTFISMNLIDEIINNKDSSISYYIERNGKLYCYAKPIGGSVFESATYALITASESRITASATVIESFAASKYRLIGKIVIRKINNRWLLDKYSESDSTEINND